PLLVVELASIVDKYIGEPEQNLEAVFRAVEQEDGVLLFDEADALFGKRSEVSEAKDRYANIEVAYLLQRMESFDGLAILTTNMKANLDAAFTRRLDAIIEFAEPEADERQRLWREAFLRAGRELTAEELITLGTLQLAGGAIRSIAVTTAFAAAASGGEIDKPALLEAIRDEWRKSGRLAFENRRFESWEKT
ncbi:MAG: ATP-binding protein, partial [Candidatus Nanopelagicales bacterium]|nr:ATP-binding protein [Candidatus Nanopelagicales bacterium]